MSKSLTYLTDDTQWFPCVKNALDEPSGLLAVGGDLSVERVSYAYQHGIFPWYSEGEPLLWWSPDPRAVIDPNAIRINKSLKKFLKRCDYKVTVNQCFEDVITMCSQPRVDDGTWIFPEMIKAYTDLHYAGYAHSIEIWQSSNNQQILIGGLYGVLVGSCFCGESMFSLQPNASKVALLSLGELISPFENALIDCQIANPYLMSMGAKTVSREWFINRLEKAKESTIPLSVFNATVLSPACLNK
ncbi:leucyl/phenylalanyl-tRNA--protein transferase [Psychrosphaera aestuarii]|uniref:leucyl/phenylalanyl-tRNA--protein transferase n=1 Tax=Psychrosphaera aestuarii TaxID=1266052 RepID=UPI001B323556|nr:leucyl/phenylalanyl-tRNA--protein transferase [Psychrosphaera aestuarii]